MPEIVDDKKIFSLVEVSQSIQKTLAARYKTSFWVKAEMNKLNYYPHSGHCYPDLVEKLNGKVIAQVKSTLWKDDFNRINHNFQQLLHTPLSDGIKMLFCARITFDPVHGLALRITDIDPVFSLGELEREKQETIARLKKEGVFDRNKTLELPLVPKRMAIISVQTSKGYADFLKMIDGNPWGYKFFYVLFPSLLQGDKAAESIRHQLNRIRKVIKHFDVVAIIRGGGGDVGLSCFNNYGLAKQIAMFPIPVITGIGHATNETVIELISYKNAITPTELADFVLQKFHDFSVPLQRAEEKLVEKARRILKDEGLNFQNTVRYFRSVTDNILIRSHHEVQQEAKELFQRSTRFLISSKQHQSDTVYRMRAGTLTFCNVRKQEINHCAFSLRKDINAGLKQKDAAILNISRSIANMHPENVLKRGYSITLFKGKAVTDVGQLKENDMVKTLFAEGSIRSEIKLIQKKNTDNE
jgi:exodeoxyribonuclease VII large subunit